MGAEGLEPSRPCGQRIFILPQLSLLLVRALRIGLSLYPQRSLLGQLPSSLCTFPGKVIFPCLGLAQDCLIRGANLGFPEFESGHLADFSAKAQFT
ncbi:hypothetical protein KR51_00034720 [Rubidibacter lacunae KORDI 51-2]|uniref:Uncharacterized protein n=1 Tax=Rubidibacter lacunae KORDI 51-2 TaxID=582515 RepID=U5DKF5_9CHRO|nr:hypothetical protein KR51_00034720 [Rubidibacter lacunae KORDI 51-2]